MLEGTVVVTGKRREESRESYESNKNFKSLDALDLPRAREVLALDRTQPLSSVCDQRRHLDDGIILDLRACSLQESSLLRQQIPATGAWIVRPGPRSILERAELFFALHLEDDHVFSEWEDVENEELEFHAIGAGGLDALTSGEVHVRNLFARNVESHLVLERFDFVKEGGGVKMIDNVCSTESEFPGLWIDALGLCGCDFAVFDNAEDGAFEGYDAY